MPEQERASGAPYGTVPGQTRGPPPGADWGSQPGWTTPVNTAETRVTGRRVVQYLIDSFLVWLIPGLVSIPFDRSNSTLLHILGAIVFFVLFVLIGIGYWVIWPHSQNGQTLGMKLLGLRVISKSGGPANIGQLFIRWVCLIFDAIPYGWPLTGLVGFIVILFSKDRQRIGDHLGRTLVIGTGYATRGSPQYATAEQPYTQSGQPGYQGQPGQQDMGAQQPHMQPGESEMQTGMGPGQSAQPSAQPDRTDSEASGEPPADIR